MLTIGAATHTVPIMCVCLGVGEVTLMAIIGGSIIKACHWCMAKIRNEEDGQTQQN